MRGLRAWGFASAGCLQGASGDCELGEELEQPSQMHIEDNLRSA